MPIIRENVERESRGQDRRSQLYYELGKEFALHQTVNHSKDEYVRRPAFAASRKATNTITTNTVEGYYSIFKRGMKGVYQHCKEKHLHRYLCEFDFRYSNRVRLGVDDVERTARAVQGASSASDSPIERLVTERPYGKSRKAKGNSKAK